MVSPDDALAIINYLNAFGPGRAVDLGPLGPFCDVNGDGWIAPNDVVEVINYINALGSGGEGEAGGDRDSMVRSQEPGPAMDDFVALLAGDLAGQAKRKG